MQRRFALVIVVGASVALALLVVAPAASAEATEGLVSTPQTATNGAATVEQVAATVASTVAAERAEAPTPSAAPQPVEAPQAASVPNSARATVASVVDEPVASAPSNPPVSASAGAAGRSAKATTDPVSTRTTSVVPAEAGPEATIVAAVERPVAALDQGIRPSSEAAVEGIRQDLSGTVANVRQSVAEKMSALSDRLPPALGGALPSPLLDASRPASAGLEAPFAGPPQAAEDPSQGGALSFLEPGQTGLFSSWNLVASAGYTRDDSTLSGFGRVEQVESASHRSGPLGKILPTAASRADTSLDAATPDSRGPAPLDVPLPAPRSPGAIAPGSGDAFFVPFAALLALLALVAPASKRRLGEAQDFRASTPFACALERPG